MRWIPSLLGAIALLPLSGASTCWRNTTCSGPTTAAFPGSWEKNIFAPSSRTVNPEKLFLITKTDVTHDYAPYKLQGNGSLVVYDFGREVGGIVTVKYTSTGSGALGLAFTEAKDYIGEWSDSSNGGFKGPDGALYGNFTEAGEHSYTMPDKYLRGGFRYLTLFLITDNSTAVHIKDVSLEIGFQPTWPNLRAYQGYFDSNDDLLNAIWYSGAYTLQTNEVPVNTGRQIPTVPRGWANNATLGPGDTIIVDGAKRDRAVWPGDMGIAVPAAFVSIGNLESVKNALQVMYNYQASTGAFDESGPPLSQKNSDTYHMWSMVGTYNYILYTNDTDFLETNWAGYKKAMDYIYGAELATWAGDTTGLSDTYTSRAQKLREAINKYCWDDSYGAFKDNATDTTLHPQDANSMALLFGVVDSERAASISEKLTNNWTPIGAVAPELPENISPFISSFEIQGHFTVGQPARALELIRRSWGWYYNNPNGTRSTVIEGYLQNGTFGYRSSRGYYYDTAYVSHAHGWSAGPTSALTNYIVGLTVTSPLGATWKLAPQFGDLKSAQAGFTTALGKFKAAWTKKSDKYTLEFTVPKGTTGNLTLPYISSKKPTITIDGNKITKGVSYVDKTATVAVGSGGSHKVVHKHTRHLHCTMATPTTLQGIAMPWRTCNQCIRRHYLLSRGARQQPRLHLSTTTPARSPNSTPANPLRTARTHNINEKDVTKYQRSMILSASGIAACAIAMYGVIKLDLFGLDQHQDQDQQQGSEPPTAREAADSLSPSSKKTQLDGPNGFPSSPSLIRLQGQDSGAEQVSTGTSSVPYFPATIRLPKVLDAATMPLSAGDEIALSTAAEKPADEEEYQLLGLGIRTVSFLKIQVYVVGMYVAKSDISELQRRLVQTAVNPPAVQPSTPSDAAAGESGRGVITNAVGATAATSLVSTERDRLRQLLLDSSEQGDAVWDAILREGGLRTAFRIVPVRNTDFTHMRDAFVRGISARAQKYNPLRGEYADEAFGAAVKTFKALFGGGQTKNVPKGHTVLLVRNARGQLDALFQTEAGKPTRYMGRVADERVSRLVWMNYLAGKNVSSEPARESVVDGIMAVVERPVGTVVQKVL
ncbi:Six-hairpin glycosidase [Aspergillus homomorphus CBS 101889]|uniref:Six-hairpin glycosidase n=1 Tax=Aspergillus homomorphus (strain CBS 101889) TaxID=1450537 RepID=A0A395HR15_ASPHC|nr:Six-hairpin glycosidase [Aspergillus homomorphus CBS 101889]RAL09929.1 Six-hairpin glycosidase [Aspergillus homomorphus CBS 101889]